MNENETAQPEEPFPGRRESALTSRSIIIFLL